MPMIAICDTCGLPAKAVQLKLGDWAIPEGWTERNNNDKPGGWQPDETLTITGIYCSKACKTQK